MNAYTTILAAIDLTDESTEVLSAAQKVAEDYGAELHVMTVIPPLNYAYAGYENAPLSQAVVNFERDATKNAEAVLKKLCSPLGLTDNHIHIVFGRPADDIKAKAENLGAELIVVGSHGRHGLGLLLGSTANGVLHGSPSDVLTVRINNEK